MSSEIQGTSVIVTFSQAFKALCGGFDPQQSQHAGTEGM